MHFDKLSFKKVRLKKYFSFLEIRLISENYEKYMLHIFYEYHCIMGYLLFILLKYSLKFRENLDEDYKGPTKIQNATWYFPHVN